jgi:glycosyltransferase involved in cell wall biosynthesis
VTPPPLSIVCIEPTFPGRLGWVADWLVRRRGYRCLFVCGAADPPGFWPPAAGAGIDVVRYDPPGAALEAAVPWPRLLERGLAHATAAYRVLEARNPRPVDLVLARSAGLGAGLFVPSLGWRAPVVLMADYHLAPRAHDLADETAPDAPADYWHWRRSANAGGLLDLESAAAAFAPTAWERDLYPAEYRADLRVQWDGVDPPTRRPPGAARVVAGRPIPPGVKLVTFAAPSLSRVRGFDRFAALVNRLLRERADVLAVAVGDPVTGDAVDVDFYGRDYPGWLLARGPWTDPTRVWLPGRLPPSDVAGVLAATDLHVDPSRAYPVSGEFVTALGAGVPVLAWDTPAAREFIRPGESGLLAGDADALARAALKVLADPAGAEPLGRAAAEGVRARYTRDAALPQAAAWFADLAGAG